MNIFSLEQLISKPTRVTQDSSTVIDLILVSNKDKVFQSGVLPFGISDHSVTFCSRKTPKHVFNSHNTVKIRSLKGYSLETFLSKLRNINWFKCINCEQVNESWSIFKHEFMSVMDEVAPIKEVRLKQSTEHWFNSEIVDSISKRDIAYRKYTKYRTSEYFNEYTKLRNLVQRQVKTAKCEYVKDVISENKSQIKKLWKAIKDLGMLGKSKAQNCNIGLKADEEVNFDKEFVANKFNSFFCNIASKLVSQLPTSFKYDPAKTRKYYKNVINASDSFSFSVVTEEEVHKLLSNLNTSKSTGQDGVSARFLRDGASVISTPITYILNLSLTLSKVPDDFKIARVVPLYKKGDKNMEGNYRPVSILPVISKIFEKVVHQQFYDYLSKHNILYQNQSGFRVGYSTDSALISLTDRIKCDMDGGCMTGLVLLDLQKAFDTVNHAILLDKLSAVGVTDSSVSWFRSYLTSRGQFVEVNGTRSSTDSITCGVPQGSILGPLLFLLYVNDMKGAIEDDCDLYLYADDSALAVTGKNVSHIEQVLSKNMNNLSR